MANKDELKKQAEELGITVGANWNKEQIEAEIDKALAEPAEGGDSEDEASDAPESEAENESEDEQDGSGGEEGEQDDEDEDEDGDEESDTFKNVASGPVFVCGHRVHRNGHYTLTDTDRRDTKGMKRLARAVELGLVEKV